MLKKSGLRNKCQEMFFFKPHGLFKVLAILAGDLDLWLNKSWSKSFQKKSPALGSLL